MDFKFTQLKSKCKQVFLTIVEKKERKIISDFFGGGGAVKIDLQLEVNVVITERMEELRDIEEMISICGEGKEAIVFD